MNEDRVRILNMLAEGKITAVEAEQLLDALEARVSPTPPAAAITGDPGPILEALPKYLYVKVESENGDRVNVKVPIALVRSGLKLTSLIPADAMAEIDSSMAEHGMSIDFSNLKPDDIDELVEALRETEITVDSANGDKVRVYAA
jgi:hypothetical protein